MNQLIGYVQYDDVDWNYDHIVIVVVIAMCFINHDYHKNINVMVCNDWISCIVIMFMINLIIGEC